MPKNNENDPCDICPKAKQHRLHFQLSVISSCAPFELVHIDTWAPTILRLILGIDSS